MTSSEISSSLWKIRVGDVTILRWRQKEISDDFSVGSLYKGLLHAKNAIVAVIRAEAAFQTTIFENHFEFVLSFALFYPDVGLGRVEYPFRGIKKRTGQGTTQTTGAIFFDGQNGAFRFHFINLPGPEPVPAPLFCLHQWYRRGSTLFRHNSRLPNY